MTTTIDRRRLTRLTADETALFAERHPRSLALSDQAREHMLDGVPMNWMTRWAQSVPALGARGARVAFLVRRRARVPGLLSRRHGGDDRPQSVARGRGGVRPAREGHHHHAAHRRRAVGGGRAVAAVRPALLAGGAHGDGRQSLRRAPCAPRHEAPQDPRLQLLLSRVRRRDDHHDQRRRPGAQARQRRPSRRPHRHDQGDRIQRRRGAGEGARARRRGLRAGRACAHQHRHRAPPNRAFTTPCAGSRARPAPC